MRACGREFSPDEIGRIQQTIDREPALSRRALSRRICGWLNWRSLAGKLKEMSCRAALVKLARGGAIQMPPAAVFSGQHQARPPRPDAADGGPTAVAGPLAAVQPVEVLPVGGPGSVTARVWS